MSSSDPSADLRLPAYFPRAPRACAAPASALFACLTAPGGGVYSGGDATAARAALASCAPLLPPYSTCVAAALTARQKELARAPPSYLAQLRPQAPGTPAA